jgi:hypothetical protein
LRLRALAEQDPFKCRNSSVLEPAMTNARASLVPAAALRGFACRPGKGDKGDTIKQANEGSSSPFAPSGLPRPRSPYPLP